MPDPAWPCSSPETNYLRLIGPGAGGTATTMASGAAWQALMGSNELSFSLSQLNTAVTSLDFEGVGGLSSMTAVTGLNTALQLLAGWVQEKPPIAASAVAAYETAVSSMIPAEVSLANRTEQAADVSINPMVWGALTPAIVALDTEYFGEHWPHNAGAGATYGAALAALVAALAVPPPIAPLGASPAAPAAAAAAVAQAAGTTGMNAATQGTGQVTQMAGQTAAAPASAAGDMSSMMMQPMQAAMGAMQPLMGMFQAPMQAFQGLSSLPQSMMGSLGGMFNGMKAGDAAMPAADLVKASAPAAGGGGGGGGAGGGGGGGGLPGAGMTSYTRPTSSFAPENSGRPTSLKTGLLSAAEVRGPASTGMGGSAMPMSPAHAGMLGQGKGENSKDDVAHARIVVEQGPQRDPRFS
ncbi:PPE domain-containing protein [Mycolicibacterium sp. CH28]|uniref:PPE domain-containing protein n=1 Tax=Mycolicibacterium sp. CH28 TaxID=2512237 RepID=UPI001080ED21|nr:PPE domain-containing protein [Mycolicibacterium sp. CH28]TGD84498.1 PPE domain-containing protein [Mycolicibacterium sp. CH28]